MKRPLALAVIASLAVAGCSSSTSTKAAGQTVTLLTHEAFAVSDGVFDAFTAKTGIKVVVAKGADAAVVLNTAILTNGKPEGDVLWGVDNTLLSRAVDKGVFVPYKSGALADTDPAALALVPKHELTPVDRGDVCVNVDTEWFAKNGIATPTKLADLAEPTYKGLTVVQNPSTSSPGLAFLFATVAAYGDSWTDYWKKLRANDVKVVDGWTTAYQTEFTRIKGGTRPIVVSYGTSPVAEVPADADPATTKSPTAVLTDSCFRQVEFVGLLKGAKHAASAQKLIDFLVGDTFQADMPMQMFVFPIRPSVPLPKVFTDYAVLPKTPLTVDPKTIEANREAWLKTWNDTVLG
jgi:thiamine transport system substrate-binding protein